MKSLLLSFVLFTALCLPGLAGNGQGQNGNGQGQNGNGNVYDVPGPIAAAGLPVIAVDFGVYWLIKRRRRKV